MKTATQKLIDTLISNSLVTKGKESITVDGQKYRYDQYILKFPFTAYWLKLMFEKALVENGLPDYEIQFTFNKEYSFHFERAKYKGERDGKIRFSKLILLD